MRLIVLSAASMLAIAACTPATTDTATSTTETATETTTNGHDMSAMDDAMKSADSTDDANTAETPDGYTFHTYPAKVESVHLPSAAGATWTASTTDTALVEIGEAKDEAMPDGATHHVVKVTPKAAGNAVVKFEKRDSADPAAPVTETRNIKFMVH